MEVQYSTSRDPQSKLSPHSFNICFVDEQEVHICSDFLVGLGVNECILRLLGRRLHLNHRV